MIMRIMMMSWIVSAWFIANDVCELLLCGDTTPPPQGPGPQGAPGVLPGGPYNHSPPIILRL